MQKLLALFFTVFAASVSALIEADGLWTGHDWSDDEMDIRIRNGVPTGKTTNRRRIITDSYMWEPADMDAVYAQSNIQRI